MTQQHLSLAVIAALGTIIVASGFFVSTGYWLVDEVIYMLSADVFLETGQFTVPNGYETFGSEDLAWMELMSVGPQGLAPQYPVGSAVVGGFFVGLFDQHGFFVMNSIAAFGALLVTRALSIEFFEDEGVALGAVLLLVFASYFTEYAWALWPHMVSLLSVITSFWLFLRAARQDNPLVMALLSGLVLGAGLLFRVDGVLLLPVIGLLAILYAIRPISVLAGGTIGLFPGLAAMAYANSLKFGTWNPLSYGGDHATEDPLKYIGLISVSVLGLILVLIVRFARPTPKRVWLVPLFGAIALAIYFVPTAGNMATRVGRGVMSLIVDATTIIDSRPGVSPQDDGTLSFWGVPKKAMGQSIPWLGCLLILFAWPWAERRRAITCILVFAVLWSFPFIMRSWHGGLSLNMRYFLPVLPVLCILMAWILKKLLGGTIPRLFVYAVVAGFSVAAIWALLHPTSTAGSHQILSTYVFLIICAVFLVAGFAASAARLLAIFCAGFGIGYAALITASDNMLAQNFRSGEMNYFPELTGKALVFDIFARSVFKSPDQIFALPHWRNTTADPALVTAALGDGFRILMHKDRAYQFLQTYSQFTVLEDIPIQSIPFQSIGLR